MTEKKLSIRWQDGRFVDIHLLDNPVADYYYKCIKYLQHVDLKFNVRKNPLHPLRHDLNLLLEQLLLSANRVAIDIDPDKLLDQEYLNYLHTLFFASTDGRGSNDPNWLEFHDLIHTIEQVRDKEDQGSIWADYEHMAGPLVKPFDRDWLKYAVPVAPAGTCFIQARELGKNVWRYIADNEPNDIDVMCKLLKTWVDLKPVLDIAVTDLDRSTKYNHILTNYPEQFNYWLEHFQKPWAEYWGISNWKPIEESAALPVGHVKDIETLITAFKNEDYPTRITY